MVGCISACVATVVWSTWVAAVGDWVFKLPASQHMWFDHEILWVALDRACIGGCRWLAGVLRAPWISSGFDSCIGSF
ncbi:hypothetical protein HPP92_020395 [Vanilla planifolia]|uniref:Uncharacterized protein n=1 Tax=Vanilla planifolia TaxID=51239 RepID=A0A835UG84_VANPL|nr:hypothetical protein HPP92_020395 [Vanilla planifolia]